MNFRSKFSLLKNNLFDMKVNKSSIINIAKHLNNQNVSNNGEPVRADVSIDQKHQIDLDLNENPKSSYEEAIENKNNVSFKYNELLICKVFNEGKHNYSNRMFVLKENGIFSLRYFNIFHEHIIYKSLSKTTEERRNFNVTFELLSKRFEFKRPTLYEYANLKSQTAVSSHFSILSLAPILLELGKNTKVLECGTGSGTMTLFLR